MKKLHEKSPCCHGRIIKFGKRRRQCVICRKTWRVYRRRRGRKRKRESSGMVLKYLRHEIPSFYALSQCRKISKDIFKRRLKHSQTVFLKKTNWLPLPDSQSLIVIADAMLQTVNHQVYTVYFILVRQPKEQRAIIIEPLIRKGPEVALGWYEVFNKIPINTRSKIKALVCDGHMGLISVAQRHSWLIQRCQFHLIARIQGYCSKFRLSRNRRLGKIIYRLAITILTGHNRNEIITCLAELQRIQYQVKSLSLRKVLSGLIKHYQEYRTYLYYPELYLPRTSNAIESLIGEIRNLFHRARGFRTLSSMTKWIHTLLKNKQKVTCNGSRQPN